MAWFRFYDEVADDPKVQQLPLILFRAWVNFMCLNKRYGGVLPDIEKIAYGLRVTRIRAEWFFSELKKANLIDEREDGQFEMHNWKGRQFSSDGSAERMRRLRQRNKESNGDGDVTSPVTDDVTEAVTCHTLRYTEQNRTEQIPPIVPQPENGSKSEAGYSEEFERFWAAYPKRVGKGDAYKSWKKIKPSQALQETILRAVDRQKLWADWRRDGGQYIPNPSTWLNQSRWDDDGKAMAAVQRGVEI